MKLDRPISKREFAFRQSFETLWDSAPDCYFWTLTAGGGLSDREFADAFNRFNRLWAKVRDGNFKGLRVFEPHKSGLLHAHVIINQRWDVNLIRRMALKAGLGRIHVRRACDGDGEYLSKYLRKNMNALAKGVRAWGKLGRWEHTKICNVEIDSPGSAYFRYAYHVLCHHIANPRQRYVQARVAAFRLMKEEAHRA